MLSRAHDTEGVGDFLDVDEGVVGDKVANSQTINGIAAVTHADQDREGRLQHTGYRNPPSPPTTSYVVIDSHDSQAGIEGRRRHGGGKGDREAGVSGA